ncbi:MAG: hypothetical protein QM804_15635 [Propionicimonas sp.]
MSVRKATTGASQGAFQPFARSVIAVSSSRMLWRQRHRVSADELRAAGEDGSGVDRAAVRVAAAKGVLDHGVSLFAVLHDGDLNAGLAIADDPTAAAKGSDGGV